uniref:Putative membrane protein n=1 Tax=Eubacterium cellulosolvens (strain ATCC 43171 / JCM 9499 / 6) TaxID=633697 RepID=I5ATK4_EUBC6
MKVWVVWISYLGVLSLLALILYGVDKAKAKANAWRISEKTLLGAGFFGGSVGALLGMKLFRHKTKHWYFWAVNLLGLIWQVGVLCYILVLR